MSFAQSLRTFAAQSAAHRAEAFSGAVTSAGVNLHIGTKKFRGAFAELHTGRVVADQGDDIQADAVALVPHATGITPALSQQVHHLPSGQMYTIVQIPQHPAAGETKIVLRRHNGE